ncbi:hypothetical protein MNBD_GAMMA08-1867 [hydrothermal vent metagenome]|uniref:Outer-membrane lipoprotein LolB n=1 Tax=hydrothermal vent metagenome TaxID=652676 RepID=A0A3B0XBJ2_9ZZZZ
MKFSKSPLIALLIPCVFLFLSACATTDINEKTPELINWQQHQLILTKLQRWTINGRLSVQTEYDGGQADFTWQQNTPIHYDIRLLAPMGAGTILIHGRDNGVTLKSSSGAELFDTNVDSLMFQLKGWPIPVSGLQYWVRGLPAPKSSYEVSQWSPLGFPEVMLQDGWRIEFRKYTKIENHWLPKKLFISRLGDEEVDVRLIIRQWQIKSVVN